MRINQRGLNRYTGDEARPSVALGPDGAVAVAWTARNNDIMLAIGRQNGEVFDPPVKLNQDDGKAYRTMPSTAFSSDGAVHTVWLDPREAPPGREEPSDLYYAQVENGVVQKRISPRNRSLRCVDAVGRSLRSTAKEISTLLSVTRLPGGIATFPTSRGKPERSVNRAPPVRRSGSSEVVRWLGRYAARVGRCGRTVPKPVAAIIFVQDNDLFCAG